MSSFLVYWKDYEKNVQEYGDSIVNELWHTKRKQFYDRIRRGDDLWVVISGGAKRPGQWFLRQRIRVARKEFKPDFERPYRFVGDKRAGEKFEITNQPNLESTLRKLEFESGKKIKAKGRLIGRSLEMYHCLTDPDIDLLSDFLKIPPPTPPPGSDEHGLLPEDGYIRETKKQRKVVERLHNGLSNAFYGWLEKSGYADIVVERKQIDFVFGKNGESYLAELKVSGTVGSTQRLREAIGQILEYNYFAERKSAMKWVIILDRPPNEPDLNYLRTLKRKHKFPLSLGWKTKRKFVFAEGLEM
jgi:hypothetical protein